MSARIRFRPRFTQKTCGFFLPSARIAFLLIFDKKKHFILVDKKNIPKKNKFILGNKKTFFLLVFLLPSLTLFIFGILLFILSPSLTFPEICPMFFLIWSPSLTFPKIGGMFFLLNVFFYRPPSLDFGFCPI